MVQIIEKKETLLDKVLTVKPTQRVERQRQSYLNRKLVYSIHRDRIEARVMKETDGEPMVTRKAKVFSAIVRGMPIDILPDELIVGWFNTMPDNCPLPVKTDHALENSLDTFSSRERNPILITEEQKRELREEIIPFWRGQGKWELTRLSPIHYEPLPPEVSEFSPEFWVALQRSMAFYHIGHFVPNNEKVLKKGFLGIKKDAEERLGRIDHSNPEELRKIPFLEGVIMAMEAASEIGKRFAAKARELAKEELDAKRRVELFKIAEICEWIPANPARTFYEAMQSVWFSHILHWWEVRDTAAISPGRMDQYLYPYYEADKKEGRITKEEVQELIDCFLLRPSWFLYSINPEGYLLGDSHGIAHHVDVGGFKPDGTDATNELSYMFIEGMMHTRLTEPNFGVLVHSKTPDDLLIKACQLCALGTGHPIFLNNDNIVVNLLGRGTLGGPTVPLELARKAGTMGCNEPTVSGMDSGFMAGVYLRSLPGILELVLTNHWRGYPQGFGLQTGDPRQFKTFEEFREAFRKQLAWVTEKESVGTKIGERLLAEIDPTIYQSALIEDCIEKGICREAGGARYNFGPFVGASGVPDVGNSLTAIKKLVFDEKKITMDELCNALDKNFEGYDELRQMLLNAPKFGNDDDYADEQTAWVMHTFSQEAIRHENIRGGHRLPIYIPLSTYVNAGKGIGALPSGRLAGEPLADSIAPTQGSDVNGPTAILKSVGKINNAEVFAGISLNMRLDPMVFKAEYGFKRMANLIRTFIDQKIHHIQFNVVSSDTLRAAQKEPDKFKDLMVRVAGYVARYVGLTKSLQDGIINRTEHGL